ncbi:putative defensin, plant [Medicago truncatula]|uniref:Defensin-like protein n=1 Tax=Medicago truncatula TaxID=3880 RepID=I3SZ44_MEDTR|nr:defensin-like protein 19 isoform X2 [Medicago truncatula]AFK45536.1 unknown [Medicago truncatula]KEH18152.1 Defensin-like protein [Medicago truncatula]RHN39048.1 putative defensin, plant [Medicago truncatula]
MTSSASKFYTIFIFVCLAFLFISTSEVEAKLCQKRSTTWSGPCLNTGNCKRQCINVEHATFGACHRQGFGFACFCYKKCAPKKVEPKLCERRSKTWSGPCLISGNCKRQCINVEHATSGACHRQGIGFACFCKKKC